MPLQLLGLGASSTEGEVQAFLSRHADPTYKQVVDLLTLYPEADREVISRLLVAGGASPAVISSALASVRAPQFNWDKLNAALSLVGSALAAYHGYRRNQSIGWGLLWGASGMLFPLITTTFAVAQGFGRRPA